jgi:hypothetical protein
MSSLLSGGRRRARALVLAIGATVAAAPAGAQRVYLRNDIEPNSDPTKRLLAMINYNDDIGDYMEWSGQGMYAIDFSNDAYEFATNHLVYGLTD